MGLNGIQALRTKIGGVDSSARRRFRIKSKPRIGLNIPISQVELLPYRNGKYYTVPLPSNFPLAPPVGTHFGKLALPLNGIFDFPGDG